jgi:signal transduction histidine kinase
MNRLLITTIVLTLALYVSFLFYFKMNLFALSGLSMGFVCFLLSFIISAYAKNKMHRIWVYFNLCLGIWGIGTFVVGISQDYFTALIAWRVAYAGILLVSVLFYHMIYVFCSLNRPVILRFVYLQGILVVFLAVFTKLFINNLKYLFNSFFYNEATFVYLIVFILWIAVIIIALFDLFNFIRSSSGIKRIQAQYLFWAMLLGCTGGATVVAPAFGMLLYPYGHFAIGIYAAVSTYAIFRYQLVDIKIVATRLSIFIVVYALVLGLPVWLGFKLLGKGLWLLPVTFMGILATIGPFIYLFIQKRTEDRLLQEQRRYQATLRQASAGMGKIKDLKKLLNMIVYVLTHAIQIQHALIYVQDESQKKFVLGASKRKSGNREFLSSIEEKSPLVQFLSNNKNLIIFEEIKQRSQDNNDSGLSQVAQIILSLGGELVVPIFIDEGIVAIIFMGKKESGKLYTEDDLGVFSILANQTALAIENAKFYEDMKFTHDQLFQAEKMATIGTMADGLSHQINNRFHALGFIAGDAMDTIHMNQNELTPEKMKEVMTELERAFVRVQENVVQGGEIVQGLLRYTRKGEAGFTPVDVKAVFKSALEMAQFKIKTDQLKIIHDYDPATIPKVKANFTQLQEVFFNLIDNGYDAMMQRKTEAKEPSYQPTLIVRVLKEENEALIIFEDNGMGVKEEDMHKLFTPFFTTKLSSKKGTGLGLYVIKKIVEDNHGGSVEMVSKYMQGTQMKLRLPIAIG